MCTNLALNSERNGNDEKQCDVDGTEDADDSFALDNNEFTNNKEDGRDDDT